MNKIYYFTFTILILLNFDVWAKGGDGHNPKKDARIIKKQLKKNLKGAEANYVFDLRGDYYNTSFLSDENKTKFNDIADIFFQETGYRFSFINVQDYLMNGTESKEDLERIRDEYIKGLEENVPDDAVYFLLIPQTDVNLEGILETQFTFNVLIGTEVDTTVLNDFMKNRHLENDEENQEEKIDPRAIYIFQNMLLSQKFNNANLALSTTIVVLETGGVLDVNTEKYFFSYGRKPLKRYLQATAHGKGTYGIDCSACSVMYFLQNYGLIPPNTTRRYFEYLFTSLKSEIDIKLYTAQMDSEEGKKKEKSFEPVNHPDGLFLKPKEIITDINFLRGVPGTGISPKYDDKGGRLIKICRDFLEHGYHNPLNEFHDKVACSELFANSGKNLINIYNHLTLGLKASYFERHVILVGIYHDNDPNMQPGHYCVIVNKPREVTVEGVDFWVYPVDDPLQKNIELYVPKFGEELDEDPFHFQKKYILKDIKKYQWEDPYLDFRSFIANPGAPLIDIKFNTAVGIPQRMIVEGNALGVSPRDDDYIPGPLSQLAKNYVGPMRQKFIDYFILR